jgi:hypothetical protein
MNVNVPTTTTAAIAPPATDFLFIVARFERLIVHARRPDPPHSPSLNSGPALQGGYMETAAKEGLCSGRLLRANGGFLFVRRR